MNTDRRTFLKLMGIPAVAAALPANIAMAEAIPAHVSNGSIEDVEHVIFLMQENRSFDHYFGTLRGVRGFNDPRAVKLPSGKPVWNQPNGNGELLPFRPDVPDVGKMFLPDPPHGWNDTHAAWNHGRYDQWVQNKGIDTMTFHTRKDLPYQYALADAFTVCDNYHCSLLGPTDPNRYHMWTGWVGNDGAAGGPVITNAEAGYDWSTYPERLERNGISWKVYQDIGLGLDAAHYWGWTDDPFIGNYGDNALLYFHQYQNAAPGNPLADKAKTGTNVNALNRDPMQLLTDFRADVENGNLPKVSWIVAPEAYTEHPNWAPDFGAWYVSQVVDILAANPEVWGKMALFVTYDEEGGFFDHMVPPTPPTSPLELDGISTVPTTNEIFAGDANHPAGPYGLGIRVPMIVVSPWTRGGYVNSELFDHTSLIQFLEARFGTGNIDLTETNITPWRRAVTGDLTSAFDFETPNAGRRILLPDTDDDKPTNLVRVPDEVPVPPSKQSVPKQESGIRPARALPYSLHADAIASPIAHGLSINFANTGQAAAVFQVRALGSTPKTYTVEAGKHVSDVWATAASYDVAVYGPNGFYRSFVGSAQGHLAPLAVSASYDEAASMITLSLTNRGATPAAVAVFDAYTKRTTRLTLGAGASATPTWSLQKSGGWYDLSVSTDADRAFRYSCAGHLENGEDSISDPLMGGLV